MGYYFEKARSLKDLDLAQKKRYEELRSSDYQTPQELSDRIKFVKRHIGPVTSGEIWSAAEELIQDTVVTWILADEDPLKVEWSDPDTLTVR